MPEPTVTATPAESLERYATVLRRRWPLVIAIAFAAALAGLAMAAARPRSYEATSKVLLGEQRQVDALLGATDYSPDPEREINTNVQLVTQDPIADEVRRSLHLSEPTDSLVARVTTAVDRNSNIVAISASDATAAQAAAIANAFATGYRDYRDRSARAAVRDAIAGADARLRRLPRGSERTSLHAGLRRLRVAQAFQTGGVQVVDEASAASATRRPRPLVSGLLGGCLGLVIAGLTVVLLARTDRRVSGPKDLEQLTGRRVVARIPRSRDAAVDAYATLAVSLVHERARGRPGVVLLASPGPGEGTPDVTLGLASALDAIGSSVITIEAELRTPTFSRRLELAPGGGLAAVLAGTSPLEAEIVTVGPRSAVLPAGSTVELPQAVLAGERMTELVEDAQRRADMVLVATAPAGRVGDAVALASLADEVLLVARLDVTRADELQRAVRALTDAGKPPAGIVATMRPGRSPLRALRAAPWRTPKRRETAAPGGAAAQPTPPEVSVG
jgi:Mrp family chromosome partitioning ATPase